MVCGCWDWGCWGEGMRVFGDWSQAKIPDLDAGPKAGGFRLYNDVQVENDERNKANLFIISLFGVGN